MKMMIVQRFALGITLLIMALQPLGWAQALPPAEIDQPPAAEPAVPIDEMPSEQDKAFKEPLSPADEESVDALMEQTVSRDPNTVARGDRLPMPKAIDDPAEPMNRSFAAFNDQLMVWLMRPLVSGYSAIFPTPVRKSIGKACRNLEFPQHFINCLLQGKPMGATVETGRFLVNSTVGLLGFFDPATKIGMKPREEDFGQTFAVWGWQPSSFLELPFLGPSTSRDTVAKPLDMIGVPGVGWVKYFNDLSFLMPSYMRLRVMEKDPYVTVRDLWAINRQKDIVDFGITDAKSDPSQTLDAIFLEVKDPKFPERREDHKVYVPATSSGHKFPYSLWIQPHRAPLVFFIPGVGSHRLSGSAMAMAEMVYNHGFSVITVSNALNWEFMETASRAAVPGYTPVDARDVYTALDAIYRDVKKRYPYQIDKTAIMGLSLGALHTLFISGLDVDGQLGELRPDRYIAINPPVDLLFALSQIDAYYNAPMQWPAAEREQRVENTLLKAVKLSEGDLTPSVSLPFDYVESQFLIGLNFRFILRDIIFSSQRRENQGVLRGTPGLMDRQTLYNEIYQYSFIDYMNSFVLPYYMKQSEHGKTNEQLMKEANLWSIEKEIEKNPKIRVFTNTNDFLLRERDIDWLHNILDDRMTEFNEGGHLGNLHQPRIQDRIMQSVSDLNSH